LVTLASSYWGLRTSAYRERPEVSGEGLKRRD
jgi:hypothetical protein